MLWIGRMAAAVLGTWLYYRLNAPDWRNRFCLLYDIPTLPFAFACTGEILYRFCRGERIAAGIHLAALLAATASGYGAQYRSWPLSGHLTVAITAGLLIFSRSESPLLWRWLALLPITFLLVIRVFYPQSILMGNHFNTLAGLLCGALIGYFALLATQR